MQVLIIGGGIGGLALAVALQRAGIDYTVFEQAPELREVGAGITLWPNALRALGRLGLADETIAAGDVVRQGSLRTQRGATLARMDLANLSRQSGIPSLCIHRARLHQILHRAADPARVLLGKKFANHEASADSVVARFDDGTEATGDALIGCDGLRSSVRRTLFGNEPLRYAGHTCWRGIAPVADGLVAPGMANESWGRGSRFGYIRLGEGSVYWFTGNNSPAGGVQRGSHGYVRGLFDGWHEPIMQLVASTPDDAIFHDDIHDRPPRKGWSRGRVALLGDAIHPTTPNMGQGGCMAIESALVLADKLAAGGEIEEAFRAYEAARYARTARVTHLSWKYGVSAQWRNPLMCAMRNLTIRVLPPSLFLSSTQRLVDRDD